MNVFSNMLFSCELSAQLPVSEKLRVECQCVLDLLSKELDIDHNDVYCKKYVPF